MHTTDAKRYFCTNDQQLYLLRIDSKLARRLPNVEGLNKETND